LVGVDQVVTLSDLDKQRVLELAAPAREPKVVPIGLPGGHAGTGIRDKMQVVAFVGSFDYEPNRRAVRWLLGWWPTAQASLGLTKLVLIGRRATQLRIQMAGVEVRSDVPDVAFALRDADALVVPLDTGGGVRVKIIEAMAQGLPVATTKLGCEGLGLRDGQTAMIAETAEELPEAIARLIPPEARRRIAHGALEHWRAHFSVRAMANGMTQAYACALAKAPL
jgi:glycosyltransferase involved in cell wall biosynthesis